MANTDRPNGFVPVKTLSGAPWTSTIKTIGAADGEDIFLFDPISQVSGLGAVADSNDSTFLGVAVGFGKVDADGVPLGPYNPNALNTLYYDDSASTHTEWVVYYVPADDGVFEAQTATALTLKIGDTADINGSAGDTTTGRSTMEITTSSAADLVVVEHPKILDSAAGGYNDRTAVWGRYYVMFTRAEQSFHA